MAELWEKRMLVDSVALDDFGSLPFPLGTCSIPWFVILNPRIRSQSKRRTENDGRWWAFFISLLPFLSPFLTGGGFYVTAGIRRFFFCFSWIITRHAHIQKHFFYLHEAKHKTCHQSSSGGCWHLISMNLPCLVCCVHCAVSLDVASLTNHIFQRTNWLWIDVQSNWNSLAIS